MAGDLRPLAPAPNTVKGGLLAGLQLPAGSLVPQGAVYPGAGPALGIVPGTPQQMQSAPTPTPTLSQLGQQPQQPAAATVGSQQVPLTGGYQVPTYNPTAVEWQAPDLSSYDQRFEQSLAASRQNIAKQFERAMSDIATQEGIANQVVGTLPGRYDEIWGNATQRTQDAAGRATTALERSGLGGMLTPEELMAPQMQALQGGQAAFQATVPLTQLGTQELFTRQKGALAQAQMAAEEPLNAAVREWLGTRSGQDVQMGLAKNQFNMSNAERQDAAALANITNQIQESQFGRKLTSEEKQANANRAAETARFNAQQKQEMTLSSLKGDTIPWQDKISFQTDEDIRKGKALDVTPAQEATRTAEATLAAFGTQVGFQKGQALHQTGQAETLKATPSYQTLEAEWNKKYGNKKPNQIDAEEARNFILDKARGKPWDRSVSLLLFDKGIDDSQLGPAGLLPEKVEEKGFGKGGWGWWR